MRSDPREQYWQQCFEAAARASVVENEVNIYSAHGWQARQMAFARQLRELLSTGELAAGSRALDSGCGSGAYSRIMHSFHLEVTGIDLCQASLDYATAHSPAALRFLRANCLVLPFPDAAFNLVVSIGVLQHVSDTAAFLREHLRVIRPGGIFLLMTLNRYTVLEMARRVFPPLRRRGEPGSAAVSLRRFGRRELRDGILREAPGARVGVRPVFVFPRFLAGCEKAATRLGAIGGLSLPLAIDLAIAVKLPNGK